MTQLQMWQAAEKRSADLNNLMLEMFASGEITNGELAAMIERRPDKYGRFAGFVGTLKDPK